MALLKPWKKFRKISISQSRRRFLGLSGGVMLTAAAPGGAYAWKSNQLDIRYFKRFVWGVSRPIRVAVISDLHAPYYNFATEELITAVNQANCDLIAILGDSTDLAGKEPMLEAVFQPMEATLGKFAILGNWEYWASLDLNRLSAIYERSGVQLLVNQIVYLESDGIKLRLVGLDDLLGGDPNFSLLDTHTDVPSLILSHCPITVEKIAPKMQRPAVILSGHTHGGQITPFGIVLRLPQGSGRYVRGWYVVNESHLYVSPGLGNSILPFRLGQRPTLAMIDLE